MKKNIRVKYVGKVDGEKRYDDSLIEKTLVIGIAVWITSIFWVVLTSLYYSLKNEQIFFDMTVIGLGGLLIVISFILCYLQYRKEKMYEMIR